MSADQAQFLRDLVGTKGSPPPAAQPKAPALSLVHPPRGRAKVIAVASGKGGVGKSNIAVNLAVASAQRGKRAVVVDADMGMANADVLCDLQPPFNLAHVVAGRKTMTEVVVDAPGGFRLAAGASGLANMAALGRREHDRLLEEIYLFEHDADVVLLDAGAGIGPHVLGFMAGSQQQLVVVTPDPASITDAYALVKASLRVRDDLELRVVVNMVTTSVEARSVFDRIDRACRQFLGARLRYWGHIVNDVHVRRAVRRRRPLLLEAPHAEATDCLRDITNQLFE